MIHGKLSNYMPSSPGRRHVTPFQICQIDSNKWFTLLKCRGTIFMQNFSDIRMKSEEKSEFSVRNFMAKSNVISLAYKWILQISSVHLPCFAWNSMGGTYSWWFSSSTSRTLAHYLKLWKHTLDLGSKRLTNNGIKILWFYTFSPLYRRIWPYVKDLKSGAI